MAAVARQELVAQLLAFGDSRLQDVRRKQSLSEVVIAAVAVSPRQAQSAAYAERIQHGAGGAGRSPPPIDRRLALEIARAFGPFGRYRRQHFLGEGRLLADELPGPAIGPVLPGNAVVGQLTRRQQIEGLVIGLEQEPAAVQQLVCEVAAVTGHAGLEDQVVVAAGDVERVELKRAQTIDHDQNALRRCGQRTWRRQQVTDGQKPARDRETDELGHSAIVQDADVRSWQECRSASARDRNFGAQQHQ